MEASSVRKIYIDSRRKTPSSNSSSDFEFELNRAITLPRKCVAFVTDIHLPHSWYNVDEHAQFLYVQESSNAYSPVLSEVFRDGVRKIELPACDTLLCPLFFHPRAPAMPSSIQLRFQNALHCLLDESLLNSVEGCMSMS